MRWVIALASFLTPLLVIIAIAGTCTGPPPEVAIGAPALGELRSWTGGHLDLLDRYAPAPGSGSSAVPHLALERFDRCGADRHGNPWFRLANPPPGVACGVLRRAAPLTPVEPDGAGADLLVGVGGGWCYWERRQRSGPQPGP